MPPTRLAIRRLAAAVLALGLYGGCGRGEEPAAPAGASVSEELAAHAAELERDVVEVTDGVHVAIGFGLANSILIEGDGGTIIVDTMESAEAARPVREAFDRITTSPVRAIVYTHNHADHVFGAGVLAGGAEPDVWAHATLADELGKFVNVVRPVLYERAMRQFGTYLPSDERVHCGIGPRLLSDASTTIAYLPPTHTFSGHRASREVTVAGVRLVLVHAPGETPDQIFVWLPDKRVLLAADNFYKSFPNLYAIRGTAYRDVMEWVRSLDAMRDLRPAFLVPSHTRPLTGEETVSSALTEYRDAIQFVHDQTVRRMNEGRTPDEIVELVKLPAHLASKPHLREYYGRVDWSVRSIFAGYLGWFSGDATDLRPLAAGARGERLAELAGGRDRLRDAARAALARGDDQWALELSGALAQADGGEAPEAAAIRAEALRELAAAEISANGRNYYLTQAREAAGETTIEQADAARAPAELLRAFPVGSFLQAMAVHLNADDAAEADTLVVFRFPDVAEEWTLHVRRGVAEVRAGSSAGRTADMTVTVDSTIWKEILSRKRNVAGAIAKGDVRADRGRIGLARFLAMFR